VRHRGEEPARRAEGDGRDVSRSRAYAGRRNQRGDRWGTARDRVFPAGAGWGGSVLHSADRGGVGATGVAVPDGFAAWRHTLSAVAPSAFPGSAVGAVFSSRPDISRTVGATLVVSRLV